MLYKETILNNIHKVFRRDPYLRSLLGAAGTRLQKTDIKIDELEKEFWFDSMSDVGIAILEDQLDYIAKSATIEGKREELEARWKISGKCDLKLLQIIANSWRNGQVAVMFTDAIIEITFISIVGIPRDIEALKAAIEEAKPAHLPVRYTFKYRTWGLVKNQNWGYWKNYTWNEMLTKEGI